MEEEERLEASLKEYKIQLESVALALTQNEDDADLQELKSSLNEVIHLTEENLLSLKKQRLLASLDTTFKDDNDGSEQSSNIDQELEKFQVELGDSKNESRGRDDHLSLLISELEGKKCRAPFVQTWGQNSYQNAFVMSVELKSDQELESLEDLQVRVLFCNPLCNAMKPCPYFLDGECRFSDKCKFSHGCLVKLIDLQEFKDPDYSALTKDSSCLAKYSDGLWYPAVIEDCLEDHAFLVKYDRYNESTTLNIEDILPLETDSSDDDSDEDSTSSRMLSEKDDDSECEETPSVLWLSLGGSRQPLGEWEKHTRGIASKLMEKMGYVWGQGLGKNGDGRLDPIQAFVLPQGKSLDKCMELREKGAIKDPMQSKKTKKETEKIASRYHSVTKRKTVFDFLNKQLAGKQQKAGPSKETGNTTKQDHKQLKETSNRALNIGSLQLTEEVRRAERELQRLQHSLSRNKDKDRVMTSQIEAKITSQKDLISQLRKKEGIIQREQQTRKNHRKLCVF